MLIGPGIEPIREINLIDVKFLDRFIEDVTKSSIDLPIVFVSSRPDQVEVTEYDPRPLDQRQHVDQTAEERQGAGVVRWAIAVGDGEIKVGGVARQ